MIEIKLRLGPIGQQGSFRDQSGSLITEGGDYLMTEDDIYIVLDGSRYYVTEALDNITTETDLLLTLE